MGSLLPSHINPLEQLTHLPSSNRVSPVHTTHSPSHSSPLHWQASTSTAPVNPVVVPAGHAKHDIRPFSDAYVSKSHFLHKDAPDVLAKKPWPHNSQLSALRTLLKLPGEHGVHSPWPVSFANVPMPQEEHSVILVFAYLPGVQATQPNSIEKADPAGHCSMRSRGIQALSRSQVPPLQAIIFVPSTGLHRKSASQVVAALVRRATSTNSLPIGPDI